MNDVLSVAAVTDTDRPRTEDLPEEVAFWKFRLCDIGPIGLLVTDFADKNRLRGERCSAGYMRVQYRWQRGTFVEFGTRQYGDMELHEGRKGM